MITCFILIISSSQVFSDQQEYLVPFMPLKLIRNLDHTKFWLFSFKSDLWPLMKSLITYFTNNRSPLIKKQMCDSQLFKKKHFLLSHLVCPWRSRAAVRTARCRSASRSGWWPSCRRSSAPASSPAALPSPRAAWTPDACTSPWSSASVVASSCSAYVWPSCCTSGSSRQTWLSRTVWLVELVRCCRSFPSVRTRCWWWIWEIVAPSSWPD